MCMAFKNYKNYMKRSKKYLIALGFLFVFFQSPALAADPCSRPPAPSSVLAQTGPGAGQVTLYWSLAGNADYYTVTYGLASGGYIYGSPNIGNNSQYTISGLAPGRVYYFVLTSVNNLCGSSGYSDEASGRAGGALPAAAGETKGGAGWQAPGAGRPRQAPSAQPIPLTETVIQSLPAARLTGSTPGGGQAGQAGSAGATISAEPSSSPTAFIPPEPEPFWRGWSFWSKAGAAAGVIFIILLAATSLKLKKRKTELPSVSADKMVARQTVGDEPVSPSGQTGLPIQEQKQEQEQENLANMQEKLVNEPKEPSNMQADIKSAPMDWPPPSQTQSEQDKVTETPPSENSPNGSQPPGEEELKV